MLKFKPFDKKTVPKKQPVLCKVKEYNGRITYHIGEFEYIKDGGFYGVVGGMFYYDRDIVGCAEIKHLLEDST